MKIFFNYDYDIDPKGQFYLGDILTEHHYIQMFSGKHISFLNKGATGNGGTTGFVRYALNHGTGCLILVPNRSIVQSKEEEYKGNPNVSCVYGGSDQVDPSAQVVIATYDQFPVLKKTLCPGGFIQTTNIWDNEFWHDRTIIVDEYHKIVEESGFRDICFDLTELVKATKDGCVFMSATPSYEYIELMRKVIDDREVVTYNVKYDDTTYIQCYEVKQKELRDIIQKTVDNNEQTCVFYNSVKGIQQITQHLSCDYEILCSNTNDKTLGNHYSEHFNPDKQVHFMTSAYFTGFDINTKVNQCVIIGSRESENMVVGEKDIRQIIGRFRKNIPLVHIFWLNKKRDKHKYESVLNNYNHTKCNLDEYGDDWVKYTSSRKTKLNNIRLEDILKRFDYWNSVDSLVKRLKECPYSFEVDKKSLGSFCEIPKKKLISLKKAKERIGNGENVTYEEYPYTHQIQEYMKTYGVSKMKNATLSMIVHWYKIRQNVGITDLQHCSPEERFKAVGFQDFGRYTGGYLKDALNFFGVNSEWDEISKNMFDVFGCYAVVFDEKNKRTDKSYIWMVIKGDNFSDLDSFHFDNICLCDSNNKTQNFIHKNCKNGKTKNQPKTDIEDFRFEKRKISLQHIYDKEPGRTFCFKTDLNEAPLKYPVMTGNYLYDYINEDKVNRLPEHKKTEAWDNVKKHCQTKISDMFADTDKMYRFVRASMGYTDTIIIDIDNGISFSQFKDKYAGVCWVAYPTLNNVTDDWTKYRVIVPLAHRLTLEGEYNLMTLKILRRWFCYHEDNQHQLFSFINMDDWCKREMNDGIFLEIPQYFADKLYEGVRTSKDFTHLTFDSSNVSVETTDVKFGVKSLEWCKRHFEEIYDGPDGKRHYGLFKIKNWLTAEDRPLFEQWLSNNYPSRYMDHWKSHQIKTSF